MFFNNFVSRHFYLVGINYLRLICFDIHYIEPGLETYVTIVVVDRKSSLVVELKDDTKESSYEAMGLGTYSNRKATVLSYVSIFESLWMQSELYEKLRELCEA